MRKESILEKSFFEAGGRMKSTTSEPDSNTSRTTLTPCRVKNFVQFFRLPQYFYMLREELLFALIHKLKS
jgi:hypothetical protein